MAFETDEERKRNVPQGVKKEDWEDFVAMLGTESSIRRSESGKYARGKVQSIQRTGRLGSARTAEAIVSFYLFSYIFSYFPIFSPKCLNNIFFIEKGKSRTHFQ